jgi:hypothetical protein
MALLLSVIIARDDLRIKADLQEKEIIELQQKVCALL